ncbi:hypothetical protein [Tellurirhabdus bombi]|uniref:hypothetical protein n=1 Tax=Tellurirhabdus bombi TaxID=2907205 RepID=UPI001F1C3C73|nr:hypothetical protein [Tellurirhabdus bombi]
MLKVFTRQQQDVALLENYLFNVRYANPLSVIQIEPEELALDCFLQCHIFLADSHADTAWYNEFKTLLYRLFDIRQQSKRQANCVIETLSFVMKAQSILSEIPSQPKRNSELC